MLFKQFRSRSGFVGPDLGPNCLQRLSADSTGSEGVNDVHLYIVFVCLF